MATVYLAIQESLQRPVALKVLNSPDVPGFSERFLSEGRIIAALNHAHIVTIYDIGIHEGIHYISMEYVTGGDLRQRIQQGMTREVALQTAARLAGALGAAHEQGVVHRDVKPANILFREDGTPLLTDFGIAKQSSSSGELTATGELLGTPHYLSPEQAQNRKLDGRADIYSLGIVLYEMLVGEKPYRGDSDISIIFQQVYEPLPRLPARLRDLQPLLDRMTAKDPDQRFGAMGQVLEATEPSPRTAAAHGSHVPAERSNRFRRVARHAAMGVFLVAVMAIVLYVTRSPPDPAGRDQASVSAGGPTSDRVAIGTGLPLPAPELAAGPSVAGSNAPDAWRTTASPGPAGSDAPGNADRETVEHYLALGDTRLGDFKLTTPVGDSALTYYQRALDIDPGNTAARRGMTRIADQYAVLADEQISRGRLGQARQYVDTGLEIDPFHSRLKALDRRIRIESGSRRIVRSVEGFIKDMKDKIER